MLDKIKGLRKFLAAVAAIIGTVVLRLVDPTTPEYIYYGIWGVAVMFQHPSILIAILKSRGLIKDEYLPSDDGVKKAESVSGFDKKPASKDTLMTETVDSDAGLVFKKEKSENDDNRK